MPLTDTSRAILTRPELFAGLTDETLAALREYMTTQRSGTGTTLFAEGETGDRAFIVCSGSIRVLKRQGATTVELARRGPGELVGEMALLDAAPRFATAVCETDCDLLVLTREDFLDILRTCPQVAVQVLRALASRTREADVVRLQQMEAALNYRDRVLSSLPLPMIVTDSAGDVRLCSGAAERLFGPRHQGNLWEWLRPTDPAVHAETVQATVARDRWDCETEIVTPEGATLFCAVSMANMKHPEEETRSCIWVFRDLTELRALQQQAVARERLATKGEMAGEIAHEINNYLAGNVELLTMRLAAGMTPPVEKPLRNIREAVEQIGLFADGLLRSRHPAGQQTTIDLNDFLRYQITFLRPQKRLKRIRIQPQWDETLPALECDPAELQQVFYNLLLNAADALADSGPEKSTVYVTTHHCPDDKTAQLIVADDGPGISPAVLPRLFRERVTTKPAGHGFGLQTVGRIIREHHGTIVAQERSGGGAQFVITLPLTVAQS
jgi:PAS domain S-box-containing protein